MNQLNSTCQHKGLNMFLKNNNNLVEEMYINIKELISEGFQYGMSMSGIFFSSKYGAAFYSIQTDKISMIYPYVYDNIHEFIRQEIKISWQHRNYGNKQAYFVCPECKNGTVKLHNFGSVFMCKKCCKSYDKLCNRNNAEITYDLQSETDAMSLIKYAYLQKDEYVSLPQ